MTRTEAISAVLAQAEKAVGISESPKGSNDGQALRAFLLGSGFVPGQAWCAYGLWTIGNKALGSQWPLLRTGDCDQLLVQARRRGVLRTAPQDGDAFLVLASDNDATHTGFVYRAKTTEPDAFTTIECNSNGGGSREGFEVAKRPERVVDPPGRYRCVFVRWADLLDLPKDTDPVRRAAAGGDKTFTVWIGGSGASVPGLKVKMPEGPDAERVYVPVRATLEKLHGVDATTKGLQRTDGGLLVWQGALLPGVPIYRAGKSYQWVRAFATSQGLDISELDEDSLRLIRHEE